MGELVRNSRAQSYIPFFSSCLPLKPNSEDETPSSQLPSKTRREKTNHREPSFAFLCVDLRVGQRGRGPDKRAGPSSLPAGEALNFKPLILKVLCVFVLLYFILPRREPVRSVKDINDKEVKLTGLDFILYHVTTTKYKLGSTLRNHEWGEGESTDSVIWMAPSYATIVSSPEPWQVLRQCCLGAP